MKTCIPLALIWLARIATAIPTPLTTSLLPPHTRQVGTPSADEVKNAITAWQEDINKIDTFLTFFQTAVNVPAALFAAQDEPKQLFVLFALGPDNLGDKGQAAADQLASSINDDARVRTKLDEIQQPDIAQDQEAVRTRINDIIFDRCCSVLPFLGDLWTAATVVSGVSGEVDVSVNVRPEYCNNTFPDGTQVAPC